MDDPWTFRPTGDVVTGHACGIVCGTGCNLLVQYLSPGQIKS